jgi:hypothetical protein
MIRILRFFGSISLVATCTTSCGPKEQSEAKFASDFKREGHAVSVLGVYKDGQMSTEAWEGLAPGIAKAFGGGTCEIGYGATLALTKGALSAAIQEYARANGPSDDLLAQLVPAARGDLIMIVIVAGRLPAPDRISVNDDSQSQGMGAPLRPGTLALRRKQAADPDILQLSASLYSVAERRSVAVVDLKYRGESASEATAKFASQLSRSLPGAVCTGWSWDASVDPDHIRRLGEE